MDGGIAAKGETELSSLAELPDLELRLRCELATWIPLVQTRLPSPHVVLLRVKGGILRIEVATTGTETDPPVASLAPCVMLVANGGHVRDRAPCGIMCVSFGDRTARRPTCVARSLYDAHAGPFTVSRLHDEAARTIANVRSLLPSVIVSRADSSLAWASKQVTALWSARKSDASGSPGHGSDKAPPPDAPDSAISLDTEMAMACGGELVEVPAGSPALCLSAWGRVSRWALPSGLPECQSDGGNEIGMIERTVSRAHCVLADHASDFPLARAQLAILGRVTAMVLPSVGASSFVKTALLGLSRYTENAAAAPAGGSPVHLEMPVTSGVSVKISIESVSLASLPWETVELPPDVRIVL